MRSTYIAFIGLIAVFSGCVKHPIEPRDTIAPAYPQGVSTATGDNFVEIFWVRNTEPDLAGYNVYASGSLNGVYTRIATTHEPYLLDGGAVNGSTYYYALTAYDVNGNESALSHDIAYDTPRPEGYNVALADYHTSPASAGYDFSTYSVGQYDDTYTDFFFEYYQGKYYLDVWTDTDIQDAGYTKSVLDVGQAPDAGWSPTKDAPLIAGHTYVIWTWDNHYAKLRVKSVSTSQIVFDWAYQTDPGNPRLKASKQVRGSLEAGSGVLARKTTSGQKGQ